MFHSGFKSYFEPNYTCIEMQVQLEEEEGHLPRAPPLGGVQSKGF